MAAGKASRALGSPRNSNPRRWSTWAWNTPASNSAGFVCKPDTCDEFAAVFPDADETKFRLQQRDTYSEGPM